MNLKLTPEELAVLNQVLSHSQKSTFNTTLEMKLAKEIMIDLMIPLLKKQFDRKAKHSIKLNNKTLLVLNHVLPQIYPDNEYDVAVMTRIITEINQACLSI